MGANKVRLRAVQGDALSVPFISPFFPMPLPPNAISEQTSAAFSTMLLVSSFLYEVLLTVFALRRRSNIDDDLIAL